VLYILLMGLIDIYTITSVIYTVNGVD